MAVLRIRKYGDPILRQQAKPQESFDEALHQQAADMIETMQAAEGVGLAANQVGRSNALCIVDVGLIVEGEEPRAFVNPVVLAENGPVVESEEGCLSIPEVNEKVGRKESIRLRFQDLQGTLQEETFEGMLARVLLHEIDHLKGVFFVDRLNPLKRRLLEKRLKAIAEQAMQEAID